jgi:hypothetical protein
VAKVTAGCFAARCGLVTPDRVLIDVANVWPLVWAARVIVRTGKARAVRPATPCSQTGWLPATGVRFLDCTGPREFMK